jgi:uncharacterized repeat protein (TIGR01451 family)
MKHIATSILLLLFALPSQAQILNFPDPNFKNALVNSNCVGNSSNQFITDADTNDDGEIQLEEAQAVTKLSVANQNIADLTGIENFSNLTSLDCSSNQLTALTLNNMVSLQGLSISYNAITSLSITNCFNLVYFHCFNNPMTSIDLSSTAVQYYRIVNNTNLIDVNLKNGFSEYGAINSKTIPPPLPPELYGNPNLQYICCDDIEVGAVRIHGQLGGDPLPDTVNINSYCTFSPGGTYNTIHATTTLNCGSNAVPLQHQKIKLTYSTLQIKQAFTDNNGVANMYIGPNTIVVEPVLTNPNYYTVSPANYSYTFTGTSETINPIFCFTPTGNHPDLEVSLVPQQRARPGCYCIYQLIYKNKGNQIQSGALTFSYDSSVLFFNTANLAVNSTSSNSLTWNFQDLAPMETRYVLVTFTLNTPQSTPPVTIGDVLQYQLAIASSDTDETPADNVLAYNQTVVGSFDPNDKEVLEGETISIDKIGDYLHYVVRFQNTGTDYAENIVIKDILSAKLDWYSLEMIDASHPYRSVQNFGSQLEVFFEGINLPASSTDEAASHGYFTFKIKPKTSVVLNDVIENKASIFFDYNNPIVTNTVSTTITNLGVPKPTTAANSTVYPNPAHGGVLNVAANSGVTIQDVIISNTLGQTILRTKETTFDINGLAVGTYFVTITTSKGSTTQKWIKL